MEDYEKVKEWLLGDSPKPRLRKSRLYELIHEVATDLWGGNYSEHLSGIFKSRWTHKDAKLYFKWEARRSGKIFTHWYVSRPLSEVSKVLEKGLHPGRKIKGPMGRKGIVDPSSAVFLDPSLKSSIDFICGAVDSWKDCPSAKLRSRAEKLLKEPLVTMQVEVPRDMEVYQLSPHGAGWVHKSIPPENIKPVGHIADLSSLKGRLYMSGGWPKKFLVGRAGKDFTMTEEELENLRREYEGPGI